MKTRKLFAGAVLLGLFTLASCSKDDISLEDQYVGTYLVQEECGNGNFDTYSIQIEKLGSRLEIRNLYAAGETQYARIVNGQLSINEKLLGRDSRRCLVYIANGFGSLSGDRLTLSFKIDGRRRSGVTGWTNCDPYLVDCTVIATK